MEQGKFWCAELYILFQSIISYHQSLSQKIIFRFVLIKDSYNNLPCAARARRHCGEITPAQRSTGKKRHYQAAENTSRRTVITPISDPAATTLIERPMADLAQHPPLTAARPRLRSGSAARRRRCRTLAPRHIATITGRLYAHFTPPRDSAPYLHARPEHSRRGSEQTNIPPD